MTNLDCNVTSCLHNADNCCCKTAIMVDGGDAKKRQETCCGSFDEKKGEGFKNLFKTPEKKLQVDCEAVNCVYNESRRCVAEHIGIAGGEAKEASHTECATFQSR